jgi:hypothetical protein
MSLIRRVEMAIMTQAHSVAPLEPRTNERTKRQWPWLGPLGLVVLAFLAFSIPPYLALDASRSRVPPPDGIPFYFPLLVAHVAFGAIAMLASVAQICGWLRTRYPRAHRRIGKLYVYGGVAPGGVLGLAVGAVSPFGPTIRASNVLLACLWLAVTFAGFRAAKRNRYAEHRRWMARSVVLTLSVITNRVWGVALFLLLAPRVETTFAGSETAMIQTIAGLSGWLGWVVPLLFVEWWLERDRSTSNVETAAPAPIAALES